jgi:hypothetical protein
MTKKFQATVLASGISKSFATRSEAEYWAEVINGMGKMGYRVEDIGVDYLKLAAEICYGYAFTV